jgi:ATP-binding cassette subfamily B (MDR/TAP) protein 7
VARYDQALEKYQKASLNIARSLAFLNAGQSTIFSTALAAMMFMAGKGVVEGEYVTS